MLCVCTCVTCCQRVCSRLPSTVYPAEIHTPSMGGWANQFWPVLCGWVGVVGTHRPVRSQPRMERTESDHRPAARRRGMLARSRAGAAALPAHCSVLGVERRRTVPAGTLAVRRAAHCPAPLAPGDGGPGLPCTWRLGGWRVIDGHPDRFAVHGRAASRACGRWRRGEGEGGRRVREQCGRAWPGGARACGQHSVVAAGAEPELPGR